MARHLKGCTRPQAPPPSQAAKNRQPGTIFNVLVAGRYAKDYWMYVAVPVDAPLSKLDHFLRRVWLECCGHLSAFTIGRERYASGPMADLGERSMSVRLNRVLDVGLKFSYEYDYGSTTELTLKVVALRDQGTPQGGVQLLARNEAPQLPCQRCGARLATQICTECECRGEGWLCEPCAAGHECGTEMCLPVVNSPRAGVCGYTG
jgi:hypothetical protein